MCKHFTKFLEDVFEVEARTKVQFVSNLRRDDDDGQLEDVEEVGHQLLRRERQHDYYGNYHHHDPEEEEAEEEEQAKSLCVDVFLLHLVDGEATAVVPFVLQLGSHKGFVNGRFGCRFVGDGCRRLLLCWLAVYVFSHSSLVRLLFLRMTIYSYEWNIVFENVVVPSVLDLSL